MRKILITITNFIIFTAILIFVIVLSIKQITVDTLYNTMLTQKIRQSITQFNSNIVVTDDEIKKILEKYIMIVTSNEDISVEKEIIEIIDKYNLTDEEKKEIIKISEEEVKTMKKNIINQYNQSDKEKQMIKLYNFLNSSLIKIILCIIIIIGIIVLMILQKSIFEWIIKMGFNLLIIGASFIFVFPSILKETSAIEINYLSITNYGTKIAALGLILNIIYCLIETIRINFFYNEEEE